MLFNIFNLGTLYCCKLTKVWQNLSLLSCLKPSQRICKLEKRKVYIRPYKTPFMSTQVCPGVNINIQESPSQIGKILESGFVCGWTFLNFFCQILTQMFSSELFSSQRGLSSIFNVSFKIDSAFLHKCQGSIDFNTVTWWLAHN